MNKIVNLLKKILNNNLISKNILGIFLFVFLSFRLIISLAVELDPWSAAWFAINYDFGFIKRGLIGSLLKLIFPTFIKTNYAFIFVFITLLFAIVIISILFNEIYKKKNRIATLIIVFILIVSPFSIEYLFNNANFGRLDTFIYFLTMLSILINIKFSNFYLKQSFIFISAVLCILIHQVYIFTYFSISFALLLINLFTTKKNSVSQYLFTIFVFILILSLFIKIQFYTSPILPLNHMLDILHSSTNLVITDIAVELEYYENINYGYNLIYLVFINGTELPILYLFITLLLLLPVILLIVAIYTYLLRKCENYRIKILYILLMCVNIFFLPSYFLTVDWGRWMASQFIYNIIVILLLDYYDFNEANKFMSLFSKFVEKNYIFVIFSLFWISSLDKFNARLFISQSYSFVKHLNGLYMFFLNIILSLKNIFI